MIFFEVSVQKKNDVLKISVQKKNEVVLISVQEKNDVVLISARNSYITFFSGQKSLIHGPGMVGIPSTI